MEENLNNESAQNNVEQDNNNYIEALQEMKKNTVPRETYEKLQGENKALLKAMLNGEQQPQTETKTPTDIDKIRKELFTEDCNLNNLEYVSKALELREAILERDGKDIFLPNGRKYVPTDEDKATAERVANAFQHCIDIADGDNDVFTNELQRITVDVTPVRKR